MAENDGFCLDWENRDFLEDPKRHDVRDNHRYVEITATHSDIQCSVITIRDEEIPALCASSLDPNLKWALRLLVTPLMLNPYRTIPLSSNATNALCNLWHLSDLCMKAHFMSSFATTFNPVLGDPSWKGILMRLWQANMNPVLAIAHNEGTKFTYGYCSGFLHLGNGLDSFINRLDVARGYAMHPLLVPLLSIDIVLSRIGKFIRGGDRDFDPIKKEIRRGFYYTSDSRQTAPDLNEWPRSLLALADISAVITRDLVPITQEIEFLRRQLQNVKYPDTVKQVEDMSAYLGIMAYKLEETKGSNEYTKEAIQSRVQLAYVLLQQKDNQLNHQYGADMRIISAVTLIFLPGTFMATLFSSSFWNFQPTNTGPMVSKWVWIYWIITLILTLTVWGFWRGYPVIKRFWKRRELPDNVEKRV